VITGVDVTASAATPAGREASRVRFVPRPVPSAWPAAAASREEVLARLAVPPFRLEVAGSQEYRAGGLSLLLSWLEDQPGGSWQERWLASGAGTAGSRWREVPAAWLAGRGEYSVSRGRALCGALCVAICADLVRPSLRWFTAAVMRGGALAVCMSATRDPAGFARLAGACASEKVPAAARVHIMHRAAVIMGAKGGMLAGITAGDVLELVTAEEDAHASPMPHAAGFYQMLHQTGTLEPGAPPVLRELRAAGQRTPEELIDRYRLSCQPVRDLLVEYLKERQPALDYSSLRSLAAALGGRFWKDLEDHHPGIDTLDIPAAVAEAWKQRLRTTRKTVTTAGGGKSEVTAERISYRQCLTPVRAFYLDLSQWAIEDPARWARWVVRCPIGAEEISQRKAARQRKARMDARTRERLPVLPVLTAAVDEHRQAAAALLRSARLAEPGETFTAAGQILVRAIVTCPDPARVWADDPGSGKRRDLAAEEDRAFWTWATVEVLRHTGVRIEELLEITHHSLIRYRLPGTGELIPLLQITPSKTDTERLLVVSPELAEVLSAIISRVRDDRGAVPLVRAYDRHECQWLGPSPFLFQRRWAAQNRPICPGVIRSMLTAALAGTGLTDAAGQPLRYTPHDFRRMFITDAIMNGLPPHIAQIVVGHQDINVTLGYKAVYPDEAIQSHLAFLARRRALRPTEEYRVPTDAEWAEFLGHFERRKVATGICGRAFSTPCIHEHSCLRCSMHWPDPAQRPRIAEIRDNLIARITEAEREGWLGEVEGLKISLAGTEDKLAQIDRRTRTAPVDLGLPAILQLA
jgi:integrase